MVIFFRLTYSLVTFQVMINDLLRDIIEVGDIAAFIDDVIVGTEIEEEYDNIVEEVLRRMVKNDLFMKLEKCVWKIREVGFLGVVIGPDRVNKYKDREGSESSRLASAKECERCTEVFKVGKLL